MESCGRVIERKLSATQIGGYQSTFSCVVTPGRAVEWIVERGAWCDSRPILCPLLTVPVTRGVASSDSYADTNLSTYESS
jgi:hypothetical protein